MIQLAGIFLLMLHSFQPQHFIDGGDEALKALVSKSLKINDLSLVAFGTEEKGMREKSGLLNLKSIHKILISGSDAGYVFTGTAYACREEGCSAEGSTDISGLPVHGRESFDYIVILNADLIVVTVEISDYNATRGNEITSRPFLRQFIGKNPAKLPIYNRNIDGISGATISGIAMTDTVREILISINNMVPGKGD